MSEPIWNVRLVVGDLVPAATAAEALTKLKDRVTLVGVDTLEDSEETDVFESEELDGDVETAVRKNWRPESFRWWDR